VKAIALILTVLAAVACGWHDLALHALPVVALTALLLSGRFIGERKIHKLRRVRTRRFGLAPPRGRWSPAREQVLRSQTLYSERTLRGPPAIA
jgi:hypothetical protein